MKAYMDTFYKCGAEDDGVALTVGPNSDNANYVRLFAGTEEEKAYWGDVEWVFPPELARKIGYALMLAADDAEKVNVAK